MSSVDNRIVKMQFDNTQFKKAAAETKTSLDTVDAAVAKAGKGKGLLDMAGHMETVRVKATAMQVAGVTAIATIANKAVTAGLQMAKAFTLDPIKQGFDEYELKMKSIQTILANTKGESLKTVTAALQELNTYSDKTIYNFANMTENIGKLTTAGINLKDATAVVKGFSNMVALAGGDANAAAGAMEQFGQGLQAGQIKAIDWMSISTRGLGSQSLQKAFFETARAAGTLANVPLTTTFEDWSKANGGFKGSLESGWLTTDVATKTLKIMTGDVKNVQELMKQGFSRKVAEDMLEIADNALDSATKVRTLTAFMGTLKEQIGSGWSQIMETIFGDFNESTVLFTNLSNATGKIVGKFFDYANGLLKVWAKMGGQAKLLTAIQHALSPIGAILGAIAKAWTKAFPSKTGGSGLFKFTELLERATRPLQILAKLISGQLSPTQALFRYYQWGTNVLEDLLGIVVKVIDKIAGLFGIDIPTGGILDFFHEVKVAIRDVIEQIQDLVKQGKGIGDIFSNLSFDMPNIPSLPGLPDMGSMFGGEKQETNKISSLVSGLSDVSGKITNIKEKTSGGLFNPDATLDTSRVGNVEKALDGVESKTKTVGDTVKPMLSRVWDAITGFFKGFSIDDLMASFNLAVLSTFMISISKFFNTLTKSFQGFVGTGEAINGILEQGGNALKSFQTQARAKLILNIAIALGILAVSLWLLAKIPADDLLKAMAAMAGLAVIINVTLGSLTKTIDAMSAAKSSVKMVAIGGAMMALAVAMLILAGAFFIMNKVKWQSIAKGLITIFVVMKLLQGVGNLAEHAAKNMVAGAFAIGAMAVSLVVLAGALLLFQLVKWESMAKAGAALGALTLAIGLLALIPYEGIAKVGLAMLAASTGLLAIATALVIFALVKWESIGKAAVILTVLTLALAGLMYVGGGPVGAAAFLGIGAAMMMLATAGLMLNKVDWSAIGKLAVVMTILTLGFAAFLGVITIFAPALILLSMFAGSLALLALALTGLAIAFAIVMPLLALGTGAFAAFATGAAVAIAVFLQTLALQAPIMKDSFLKILQTLIDTIVAAVPMIIQGIKDLWAAIQKEFSSPEKKGLMGDTSKSWMDKLKDGIKKKIPELVEKAKELALKFLKGLKDHAQELAAGAAELVIAVIKGIGSKAGQMATAAADLVIKLAKGLGENLSRIIEAGVKLIADFLHRLASTIRSGSAAIGSGISDVIDAMKDVGVNMVKGLIAGIGEMFDDAMGAIGNLASGMVDKAKGILDIFSPSRVFKSIGKFLVEGLTIGIQNNAASAITAVASMVGGQIAVASAYISDFVQKMDQQAIAAQAKADGLARAAQTASRLADKAANAADKTKGKGDDKKAAKAQKSAEKLSSKAEAASKVAERKQAAAEAAAAAEERKKAFAEADTFDKAKMRSEDAQSSMDAAKAAEGRAAASLAEAAALEKQAKANGVTKKQRKEMLKQAETLRKQAEKQARDADANLQAASVNAAEALAYQKLAGDEAAAAFQKQFMEEAAADANADAFDKLDPAAKAAERRRQAAVLQAEAVKDLQDAQQLAYTDLDAANELATEAMQQAEQARTYLKDAAQFDQEALQGTGVSNAETSSRVVNLDPTEAASIAFNAFNDAYSSATAAAAGGKTVEFNQYISSPEPANPSEVYRRTNNLVSYAAEKL